MATEGPFGPFSNPVFSDPGPLLQGEGQPGFDRVGPIIDVDILKADFLAGIPLTMPLTGETVGPDSLKRMIMRAVGDFETSVRIPFSPTRIVDRFDFQRADDLQFSTHKLTRNPVIKVEKLAALFPGRLDASSTTDPTDSNNSQETTYPTSWVVIEGDSGLFRVVPNSGSLVNADVSFIASSGYRSILLGGLKQWPSLWRVTYLAGFENDKVPQVVNQLIGIMAAIQFVTAFGPRIFPYASFTIGVDGLAQGVTTPGFQWLQITLQNWIAERDRLVAQLKSHYGTDMAFSVW